ncbi:hypothetical protein Dde_0392 [Oleidesulfovibrio alaskensis G20]|jgi:hypothetical protein|uniref:Uncharacterized protein n=1 Tax=Oleidesulfovibrio alaskensis (strain ATCC BAA-1058 / DSM 17464 / G20) TaxID=207559 RepID=Q316F3_OLEA2|nr:hypothetical protein [Oleidesulfovibrio alaskensis]ABB37193.1 hypothetical protein Dde_0392 [Oleidesulfovibrio alaskensis G20]MBG0772618.1 hypothetical protein [Oleidesulfovibrio alaskensis]MBL3582993.1 hypothetical protein [Oleidesulfovibrio alaskensis]
MPHFSCQHGTAPAEFDSCQPRPAAFHEFAAPAPAVSTRACTPCNGCGWCCLDHPCDESVYLHGYTDRCPELCWSKSRNRYLCRLAADAVRGRRFRDNLRMGEGCCAPQNPWRQNVRQR